LRNNIPPSSTFELIIERSRCTLGAIAEIGVFTHSVPLKCKTSPSKGDDKFIYLNSQRNLFEDNIEKDDKSGSRVRGKNYKGIDIVADYFSHKTIKDSTGKDMADILFVDNKEQAQKQYDNYLKGGAKQFTNIIFNNVGQKLGTEDKEVKIADYLKQFGTLTPELSNLIRQSPDLDLVYNTMIQGYMVEKENNNGTTEIVAVFNSNNKMIVSDYAKIDNRPMTLEEQASRLHSFCLK